MWRILLKVQSLLNKKVDIKLSYSSVLLKGSHQKLKNSFRKTKNAPKVKNPAARITVSAITLSILVAGSGAYISNAVTESKDNICVTAYWADKPSIATQTGNCEESSIPVTPGEDVEIPAAYNGETVIGWASNNISTIGNDESDFGVKNGMLSTYSDFVNNKDFPKDYVKAAKDRDASVLIAWEPWNWDNGNDQPEFKPSVIASGSHDAHITEWLTEAQVATKDASILVRFAPEMNDAVRPWSISTNGGNTAQEYIDMWKHVYDIKEAVAPDVAFMWNPLVAGSDESGVATSLSDAFPGSDYVDIVALDGFNWGDVQNPEQCGWQSYNDIFSEPISEIKSLAPGKPWGIAEVASVSMDQSHFEGTGKCAASWDWVNEWPESGEFYKTPSDWITQAGWTKTMIQQANADGALFVNMFNTQKETDWRLNSNEIGSGILKEVTKNKSIVTADDKASALIKAALQ